MGGVMLVVLDEMGSRRRGTFRTGPAEAVRKMMRSTLKLMGSKCAFGFEEGHDDGVYMKIRPERVHLGRRWVRRRGQSGYGAFKRGGGLGAVLAARPLTSSGR